MTISHMTVSHIIDEKIENVYMYSLARRLFATESQINEMNCDNDLYLIDAKYLGGVYIQG